MKSKILSLVIAVTMLFGTAGVAFATEGTVADLERDLAQIKVQIEDLTEKIGTEPTVENLEAIEAELAAAEALYTDAFEALQLSKMTVKKVNLTFPTKYTVKVSWTYGPKVKDYADKYRVRLYRNSKLWKTVYVDANADVTEMEYTFKKATKGVTYNAFVAPVAVYKDAKYAGFAVSSAYKYNKIGKPAFSAKKSGNKVVLKATDLNTNYYQVWVSKDKKFKKGVRKERFYTNFKGLDTKVVTKNFFKKGTNYIKVRPVTKVNGKTYVGKWSAVRVIKR